MMPLTFIPKSSLGGDTCINRGGGVGVGGAGFSYKLCRRCLNSSSTIRFSNGQPEFVFDKTLAAFTD